MKNPDGYETVASFKGDEVLASDRRVVVIGTPDDATDANGDSLHNCDVMGCGQSHVVAIVDRPAPSTAAQPPPVLDLDALAEAERAMTPGAWGHLHMTDQAPPCEDYPTRAITFPAEPDRIPPDMMRAPTPSDAAGIVALRNAAPHLIAEARAASTLREMLVEALERARLAEKRLAKEEASHAQKHRLCDEWFAKLAEAKRLGLEACDAAREAESRADHDRDGRLTSPRTSAAIRAELEKL